MRMIFEGRNFLISVVFPNSCLVPASLLLLVLKFVLLTKQDLKPPHLDESSYVQRRLALL